VANSLSKAHYAQKMIYLRATNPSFEARSSRSLSPPGKLRSMPGQRLLECGNLGGSPLAPSYPELGENTLSSACHRAARTFKAEPTLLRPPCADNLPEREQRRHEHDNYIGDA